MEDIKIISPIAILSDCRDGWQKELNIVSVADGPFTYDIREWRLDHYDCKNGISLNEDEARALLVKLGECFQVDVGKLGTAQIPMPVVEQTFASAEAHKPDIRSILDEKGIQYIDKREHGGALWIIGGHELDELMAELKNQGFRFFFSEKGGRTTKNQSGWFIGK